jgi:hypothetical protein
MILKYFDKFIVKKIVLLKILSNENRGTGSSKLVSIDPFLKTVWPASVLFRSPMDTITRGA